jgi:hypothetical protein
MKSIVFWDVWTNVSEERITPIFRAEKSMSKEPVWAGGYPEDGGDMFLWHIGSHKIYMTPHPRRQHSLLFIFDISILSFICSNDSSLSWLPIISIYLLSHAYYMAPAPNLIIPIFSSFFPSSSHFSRSPTIHLRPCSQTPLVTCSSLNVKDKVSHPYKTKHKITVLYILIFMF